MTASNPLDTLASLSEEVLSEVVREGELKLQGQLQASLAADARALTISGFATSAAVALLGAAAILIREDRPDIALAVIAGGLAVAMLAAACIAALSARPIRFHLPGNEPANWVPESWDLPANAGRTLKRARVEQAKVLQHVLAANSHSARDNARLVRWALITILVATLLAAIALAALALSRGIVA